MEVGDTDRCVCSIMKNCHFLQLILRLLNIGLAHATKDDDVYDGYFVPKGKR